MVIDVHCSRFKERDVLFSDLTLEKAIIEMRYSYNPIFWDSSGKVVLPILAKSPNFKLQDVKANNVQYGWWQEGLAFNFNHEKADVVQDFPANLDHFKTLCTDLNQALRNEMGVTAYSRIGNRFLYLLATKNSEAATELMEKIGMLRLDLAKLQPFGEGKIRSQNLSFTHEGDDKGFIFRMANISRQAEIQAPRPFAIDTSKFSTDGLLLDVDFFTKKPVDSITFAPKDFIRINQRTLEIGILPLLGL
jgi:hypothetical protein